MTATEYNLASLGWGILEGRGRVAVVESPVTFKRDENPLIGQLVQIDGATFKVIGVESFAVPTIVKGSKISLLVAEP